MDAIVQAPRGVACITYSVDAAAEIERRLRRLGIEAGGTLVCGTVHGWCLNQVLRPFAAVTGTAAPTPGGILTDRNDTLAYWESAYEAAGFRTDPRWQEPQQRGARRALALNVDTDLFDPKMLDAAEHYEQCLEAAGLYDFESMVIRAYRLIAENPVVREMLRARFPWLVIDEYQDLGGVLHAIVRTLHDAAGINVFAVGDVNQSIYGFQGADPVHFRELLNNQAYQTFTLNTNHRSGSVLVDAALRALGHGRTSAGPTSPHDSEPGIVDHRNVAGGVREHPAEVASLVKELLGRKVPAERIAVLYRQGPMLPEALDLALRAAEIPVCWEKALNKHLPNAMVVRFLQHCACLSITRLQQRRGLATSDVDIDLRDVFREFRSLVQDADFVLPEPLRHEAALVSAIDDTTNPNEPVGTWVARVDQAVQLSALAARLPYDNDTDALKQLVDDPRLAEMELQQFAGPRMNIGKVTLTTFHAAKGREWDYVLLPGLQEGMSPQWDRHYSQRIPPSRRTLDEERRLFYVAVTRARRGVVLITTGDLNDPTHYDGPSRFVAPLMS